MAWIRIDDQTPRHQKMLKAGPAACWLWVCAIAHAHSHLTNGFISNEALPMIGVTGVSRAKRLADRLVTVSLFDKTEGGYQVHDYLDLNPSRAMVLAKRAEEAKRKRASESHKIPRGIQTDSTGPRARVPCHPILSSTPPSSEEKQKPSAWSKRPIFSGQRLTVFEWMLDDCLKTLGETEADAFDLHSWFFELDALAVSQGLVIPKKDGGAWLQSQLVAEAQRRGLDLRMARPIEAGKLTTRLAQAIANIKREGS